MVSASTSWEDTATDTHLARKALGKTEQASLGAAGDGTRKVRVVGSVLLELVLLLCELEDRGTASVPKDDQRMISNAHLLDSRTRYARSRVIRVGSDTFL